MIDLNKLDEIKWLLHDGYTINDGEYSYDFDCYIGCYVFECFRGFENVKRIKEEEWEVFKDEISKFSLGDDNNDNNVQK